MDRIPDKQSWRALWQQKGPVGDGIFPPLARHEVPNAKNIKFINIQTKEIFLQKLREKNLAFLKMRPAAIFLVYKNRIL